MANLSDYLDWRSDITMEQDPFNEVDNLILSYLAYTDFTDLVPTGTLSEAVSITEVTKQYFQRYSEEEILSSPEFTKTAVYLLKKMVHTKRFGRVKLAAYRQTTEVDSVAQFAALTFLLPDRTCFAAFRGTDTSIVGWKEDFNFFLEKETQGQIYARDYLNEVFAHKIRKLRVGGHSKGGNLAVYASAFCKPSIQKRILAVYSNDGPGFRKNVLESEEYQNIRSRIYSYIPEESVVGILLEQRNKKKLIKTSAAGIMAHSPETWEVWKNRFVAGEKRSKSSLIVDKTIRRLLYDLDDDRRKIFIDAFFGVVESTGATHLMDLVDIKEKAKTLSTIRETLGSMSKEEQKIFWGVIRKFISSGTTTFMEEMFKKQGEKNDI
ncbi:MAG: DUF2974 domain-containing protein [Lachnospiraceae bacterium]|nr:DUF2974 domain-containing protein [Lachnospiraceae bacterium]